MSQELRKLQRREAELVKSVAKAIARRDEIEDDRNLDKKQRDWLKGRKDSDQPYNEAKLLALNAEIRAASAEIRRIQGAISRHRSWLTKTRQAIARARRRAARPRIIDLKLGFRPMTLQGPVNKVIGHYTAGPQDRDTKDAIRLCHIYHQAHLNQGWSGEAYMVCFTVDGDILVLRPARYVGAHTLGHNTGSYGVMCHGTTGDTPTRAQKRAMRWWAKHGHEPRMGSAQTTVKPGSLPWYGHNDFNATSCPGAFKPTYISKGK